MNIKQIIFKPLRKIYHSLRSIELYKSTKKAVKSGAKCGKPVIYYCGIPAHSNLGDLAQGVCIRRWLKKHYSNYHVTEIETNSLVNTKHSCLGILKKYFNSEKDFVIFQSGYTTTDLGGFADIMHQAVIKALPDANILMMPQTIFFKTEERKRLCSETYNNHKNMLFIARDEVSFKMAKKMFPDLRKECFPDIVTTLIGSVESNQNRNGIIFCLRNDTEKFYSNEELARLIDRCKEFAKVAVTDTTKGKNILKRAKDFIDNEIITYSKYKVMITDRYHGTILSLVAGTPVIVIRTTDHKVTTGVNWFKGVYDEYVYLANDLQEAYELAKKLYKKKEYKKLQPQFELNYYDKLPTIFEECVKRWK